MLGDKRKLVDYELIDKLFDSVYQTHYQYAPEAARNIWRDHLYAVMRQDFQKIKRIEEQVACCTRKCLQELCVALEGVSPVGALELLKGECPDRLDEYQLPKGAESFSLSQGAWMIGVFGNGSDTTRYGALKVFNKYVRWAAATLMENHMKSLLHVNEADRELIQTTSHLEASRLVEPETQMMWIAAEITDEIGKWVDLNADRISNPGILTSKIAAQINKNVSMAAKVLSETDRNNSRSMPISFSEMLLEGVPEDLIQVLTAPSRRITAAELEAALKSDKPNLFPFVKILDKTRVLCRSSWMMRRDDALFRVVMQASPHETEGKVFEDVATALLQRWGPGGITWQSSVNLVSPQSNKKVDDVDILGVSKNMTFICECKANRLSKNNLSVGANFDSVVLNKATSQLETRTEHWNSGWRPKLSGKSIADDVMGFIITFSSYGGLLWNPTGLKNGEPSIQFGTFSLYSLVLAVSILKSPADLTNYFSYRLDAINKRFKASDELEFILGFRSGHTDTPSEVQSDKTFLFRQYELREEGQWIDPRKYRSSKNWKNKLLQKLLCSTISVTPAVI